MNNQLAISSEISTNLHLTRLRSNSLYNIFFTNLLSDFQHPALPVMISSNVPGSANSHSPTRPALHSEVCPELHVPADVHSDLPNLSIAKHSQAPVASIHSLTTVKPATPLDPLLTSGDVVHTPPGRGILVVAEFSPSLFSNTFSNTPPGQPPFAPTSTSCSSWLGVFDKGNLLNDLGITIMLIFSFLILLYKLHFHWELFNDKVRHDLQDKVNQHQTVRLSLNKNTQLP